MKQKIARKKMEETIMLPEGVDITQEEGKVTFKGKNGTIERKMINPYVKISKKDNSIIIASKSDTRKNKRVFYTTKAHINNMIIGVTEGFIYLLKICSGHFPMSVKVEGQKITISNFLGEKIPRTIKIPPNVEVKVDKDIITVFSSNKELAGQTAVNIERATIISNRDPRVFQDGIYITEKPGRKYS
jgi:large subunit ribosomal protein L6